MPFKQLKGPAVLLSKLHLRLQNVFLKGVFWNYKEQFKKTENDRVKGHRTLSQGLSRRWLTFGCQHSFRHSNTVRRDLSLQVSMSKTRITLRQIDYNGKDGHTFPGVVSISIALTWPGAGRY